MVTAGDECLHLLSRFSAQSVMNEVRSNGNIRSPLYRSETSGGILRFSHASNQRIPVRPLGKNRVMGNCRCSRRRSGWISDLVLTAGEGVLGARTTASELLKPWQCRARHRPGGRTHWACGRGPIELPVVTRVLARRPGAVEHAKPAPRGRGPFCGVSSLGAAIQRA